MKGLIRKLLREQMISFINKWEENLTVIKNDKSTAVTTLISKDDETHNRLYLFVGFKYYPNTTEYSYSFMLLDKNNKPLSDYMTTRSEVSEFLPKDIKNKKQILPIVMNMTRELMDAELPQNIFRKTVEPVDGDSLKRYEEITNIMVNEYGYKLDSVEKTFDNRTIWKLSKKNEIDNNKDMNESYEITHEYTTQESLHNMFDWVLPLLNDMNLKPIFEETLRCKDYPHEPYDDDNDDYF
jgi:hypothetical protein